MKRKNGIEEGQVIISGGWWNSIQTDLQDAIDGCNHITGLIAAHQYERKHSAEQLIEHIEGDIREIRKLIEAAITPI